MKSAGWAIALAAILLLTSVPAYADVPSDAAPGTAVYQVELIDVSTGPSGEETTESVEGEVLIACDGTSCAVVSEPARVLLAGVALESGETVQGTADLDEYGTACRNGRGARTVTIAADSSTFTASLEQSAIDWTECADGSEAYAHARTVTWTGSLVAADPCVFSGRGCTTDAGTSSRLSTGDAAAPSVLSALPTPQAAGTAPQQLSLALIVTVILVLLTAFPTALLNSASEIAGERIAAWRTSRRSVEDERAAQAQPDRGWTHSWWWAATGVAAASIIGAFVDPEFGFNPGSARMLFAVATGFAVDVALGWTVVILLMRRFVPDARTSFAFRPLTLLVVVAAVAFTRLTNFEPGILFGLVAGVTFAVAAGRVVAARAVLIALGYAFLVAFAAWLGYGAVAATAVDSVAHVLLVETLAAVSIAGMAALPIALVPLRGMPGHAVWSWNRWVWAGCYGLGLFAFFIVLMPMPFSWEEVPLDLAAWIGIYLVYAIVAVGAWLLLARPWRRSADGDRPSSDDTGETADSEDLSRLEG